jgi:OmpA-like transmembrane domain
LGGSTCTATTTAAGVASCTLTPAQAGVTTLTANIAASAQYTASTAATGFRVFATQAAQMPAPTVSIAVSPTTVAAGSSATLTWSSTNATDCSASGAWSGTQATSGTLTVTPAANGSYTYTLSCNGAGGSAAASAVLSASLVAVTVHAKSGGGALGGYILAVLGLFLVARCGHLRSGACRSLLGVVVLGALMFAAQPSHADQPQMDPFYLGLRAGYMPVRIDAGHIDAGLNDRGFADVETSVDKSAAAGTLYVGYELAPHTAVEVGYTYRNASAATLNGSIASTAALTPLLQSTAGLIRSYGNIVSLSYAGDFEIAPRITVKPRLGGFFWATKVSVVGPDDRVQATHEGGGATAGLTVSYRVWRGLELGLNVDHFHGFPSNLATLYGGSLEWRFGH